jgi:hypothetical protein
MNRSIWPERCHALLPKLLSGELRVPETAKLTEAS